MRWGILFALFVLLVGPNFGVDLTSVNLRYQYDPHAPVKFNGRMLQQADTVTLYFDLTFAYNPDSLPAVYFYQQKNYSDTSGLANRPIALQDFRSISDHQYQYEYQFVREDSTQLVVIEVVDTDFGSFYFDLSLSEDLDFPLPDFRVMMHSFEYTLPYRDTSEPVNFADTSLLAFVYKEDFPAASPPMVVNRTNQKSLVVDSVIALPENFRLQSGMMYFVQSDSNTLAGRTLLGTPILYPRLVKLESVVQPLIYISTKREFEDFKTGDNLKAALDRFWLETTGERSRAAETIKKFYQRVAESNELFSTYKQGWKTDRGMIYMLFGLPKFVTRSMTGEIWTYTGIDGQVIDFNFNKVKNLFSRYHYVLTRRSDYDETWYRQVDLWRKGRI